MAPRWSVNNVGASPGERVWRGQLVNSGKSTTTHCPPFVQYRVHFLVVFSLMKATSCRTTPLCPSIYVVSSAFLLSQDIWVSPRAGYSNCVAKLLSNMHTACHCKFTAKCVSSSFSDGVHYFNVILCFIHS